MLVHKLDRLEDYLTFLQSNPVELSILYQEMLINVTGFFREPDGFEALKSEVFAKLLENRQPENPVRIWVPGCSSGEEAYSIAICLLEAMGENVPGIPIQIFATDVDDAAIDKARTGIYPENIHLDVSADRLRRFFSKSREGYRISKHIRDMCVFARQDVTRDPPFSKLDLVSCRNLLIYLQPVLQKKVLQTFHYAIKPGGYLMLGASETIGAHAELFELLDKKNKIYRNKLSTVRPTFDFPAGRDLSIENHTEVMKGAEPWPGVNVQKEADRIIVNRFGPSGVIINDSMDVLQFRGHTGPYLEHLPGEASLNLLKMAREGLLLDLRKAVNKAIREKRTQKVTGLKVRHNGSIHNVDVEVVPIKAPMLSENYFLVLFEEAAEPAGGRQKKAVSRKSLKVPESDKDKQITELSQELAATKEYLQSIIEEQEATNEELKSANEEIQSANEELQSTNEELETAKEELQSTNEELSTVNEELETRNAELTRLNNDHSNLLASINIPIVMLGADLRIRRFTPLAEKAMNLIATDIGRPISDIKPNIDAPGLEKIIEDVIDNVTPREQEVQDKDGHWYSLRVRPYRTTDNRIDGAILTLIDINEMRKSLDVAKKARDFAENIIGAMKHPLLVLDQRQQVVSASESYLSTFQVSHKEVVGNLLHRLGNGQWGIPKLRKLLAEAAAGRPFEDFVVDHDFEHIGHRLMSVSGRSIRTAEDEPPLVLMEIEDITKKGNFG